MEVVIFFYFKHYSLSLQAHSVPGKFLLLYQCANSNVPSSRKPSRPPRPVSNFLGLFLPQILPSDIQILKQLMEELLKIDVC